MKAWFALRIQAAIAAAATLTGKRFGLLVASSLVATSAIVAAGMSSGGKRPRPAGDPGRPHPRRRRVPSNSRRLNPNRSKKNRRRNPKSKSKRLNPNLEPSPEALLPAPEPEPVEEVPAPEPEPEPEPEEETPPPHRRRETGNRDGSSTSSSSPWPARATKPPSARDLADALPLRHPAPPGRPALQLQAARAKTGCRTRFASIGGQKPTPDSEKTAPNTKPASSRPKRSPSPTSSATDQFSWSGYFEGMVDTTGKPASCVYPEPGAEEAPVLGGYSSTLNPFVYFHSLLDLGACSANSTCPSPSSKRTSARKRRRRNFSYISPNLCNVGVPRPVRAGGAGRRGGRRRLARDLDPEDPEVARLQERRPADRHLRRRQPGPESGPDPAADAADQPQDRDAPRLPRRSPPAPPTPPRYDPYSLLATNDDLFGLDPLGEAGGKKVKSLGTQLLGTEENGGD